jgi:hypothetical protein
MTPQLANGGSMTKRLIQPFSVLILLITALPMTGCALFLLGAGAAGGYAISKDEIEAMYDAKYDKVWNATKTTLQHNGALTLDDRNHGKIEAIVGGSTINVMIDQVTAKTVRLRIKARKTKGLFPDIDLAQEINEDVMKKL